MHRKFEHNFDAWQTKNKVTRWEFAAGAFAIAIFGVLSMAVWVTAGIP